MNILNLYHQESGPSQPLFSRMEHSLKSAGVNFEKSVRLAKTLAPILQDQSSNDRHLSTIASDAPTQEKVIAIIMLGFPRNRQVLPTLKTVLQTGAESLRMACAIAIAQMGDSDNREILTEILMEGFFATDSLAVKRAIRQSIVSLMDKNSADLVTKLFDQDLSA